MFENRVYRIILREANCPWYRDIEYYCHQSKNLYNYANYILKQRYSENDFTLFNFYRLREYIRENQPEPWKNQLTTHVGAETLRVLVDTWKGYFEAKKRFKKEPDKFKGPPKPPGYLPKNGTFLITFDTTNFRIAENEITFPKKLNGFTVSFAGSQNVKQVRIVPHYNHIAVEVVYRKELIKPKQDNEQYLSIDLGVSNFAAITSNVEGFQSLVVNGKGLQAVNQYYNKNLAHYRSIADSLNQGKQTRRIQSLIWKRNQRVYDFVHKASRFIADLAEANNVSNVVVGYNAGWKQEINLGSGNNQKFVSIPYLKFIKKLEYKLKDKGISLTLTNEGYTSKTSFLDNEQPCKQNVYKGKRKHRGLFVSESGIKINADVNASYQILKKVFPKAYKSKGIMDVSLHPVVVNVR